MKYLYLLIFLIACNSSNLEQREVVISDVDITDSLSMALDSLQIGLVSLSQVSDYAKDAQARIEQLEKEKSTTQAQVEDVHVSSLQYMPADKKDEELRRLTEKLLSYEREIARLKRRVYNDSLYMARVDRVPNKEVVYEPHKPDGSSLVIKLNKAMRGDGEISEQGVRVYIMPYNKVTRKQIKKNNIDEYEISCNYVELNKLNAQEADFYEGQYFFNGIPPGKYLIKVCAYYGNAIVIKRENKYQMVEIKMSPPIQ